MKANVEASSKITTVSLPRPDALGSDCSPTFAEIDTKPAAGAAPAGGPSRKFEMLRRGRLAAAASSSSSTKTEPVLASADPSGLGGPWISNFVSASRSLSSGMHRMTLAADAITPNASPDTPTRASRR